ncbi:hypothetical protein D3C71_2001950 [compost metagenome]
MESRILHLFFAGGNVLSAVVRRFTTAQDHMAVWVTLGLQQANLACLIDTDKTVRHGCSTHRVDGRAQATVRTVFEAHRH